MTDPRTRPDPAFGLLELYDDALPHVYGYLLARCGDPGLAEDLTSESFLAAVHASREPGAPGPTIPWLIGVARHKLADHWRRAERERHGLRLIGGEAAGADDDPWETELDRIRAREVLSRLGPHHRAALTLREPVTPADPDPGFAGRLRRRLAREALASSGGNMSQETVSQQTVLIPHIMVSDARRAMDWYAGVFGARRRGEPVVNADGTIGHAEVSIGGAVLMLAEQSDLWPDVPVRAPENPVTFSYSLNLEVEDVDGTADRARRGGATVEREPADQFYGRGAVIVDPFGHRWMLVRPAT